MNGLIRSYVGKVLRFMIPAVCVAGSLHAEQKETKMAGSIHEFEVRQIDGTPTKLAAFNGQVMLIVNVASRCGFTGQYAGLEKLYETYKDKGWSCWGFLRMTSCSRNRVAMPRSPSSAR